MSTPLTIDAIKKLLVEGKTEAAADALLILTEQKHQSLYETAFLIKNRIELLQQQEIEGTISHPDDNLEWAKISKSVLMLVTNIEKKETKPTEPLLKEMPPPLPLNIPWKKILLPLGIVLLGIAIYFMIPKKVEKPPFDLEIAVNTEGVLNMNGGVMSVDIKKSKLQLSIGDTTLAAQHLNKNGQQIFKSIPAKYADSTVHLSLIDLDNYHLTNQSITVPKENRVIHVNLEVLSTIYKGHIIFQDGTPAPGAIVDIGHGMARDTADEKGAFEIKVPNSLGQNAELIIYFKDKAVIKHPAFMLNEQAFLKLKIP